MSTLESAWRENVIKCFLDLKKKKKSSTILGILNDLYHPIHHVFEKKYGPWFYMQMCISLVLSAARGKVMVTDLFWEKWWTGFVSGFIYGLLGNIFDYPTHEEVNRYLRNSCAAIPGSSVPRAMSLRIFLCTQQYKIIWACFHHCLYKGGCFFC